MFPIIARSLITKSALYVPLVSCSYFVRRFATAINTIPTPLGTLTEKGKPFELFKQPRVEVPSFDIFRRMGNIFAQYWYRKYCEKNYTLQGLLNGAIQAAYVCSVYMAESNWERLKVLMSEECFEELRERLGSLSEEEVSKLKFSDDDVICSFLHLCCFCGRKLFGIFEPRNFTFIAHVVIYIRKDKSISLDESPKRILKNASPGSLQIINITLVRCVNPMGFWKIEKINYFDPTSNPKDPDVGLFR